MGTDRYDRPFRDVIQAAVAGDEAAWCILHAFGEPVLRAHASACLGGRWFHDSHSDVVQDAWLKVRAGLAAFRGADTDEATLVVFAAWLRVIVGSVVRNRLARRPPPATARGGVEAETWFDPADPAPSVGHEVRTDDDAELVRAAVAELPDAVDRAVIRLRFLDGLSLGEVGDRLGLTYDEVRGRVTRALRALARKVEVPP